jgi:UDP-glucose 4-epimerase
LDKILVTGGAGFIGSGLCDLLLKQNHKILCIDNLMNSSLNNIWPLLNNRKFKFIYNDIRNDEIINDLVKESDIVVHLAAQIHTDRSIIEPLLTYDINVLGTLKILELCRRYDLRCIYASTSEVYGSAIYTPMNEDHPLNAPHPYGASKLAADRMCNAYIETYGLDITILRAFNTYGPKQKNIGYGGVISIFIKRVLNGEPPIIYGDGNQTRDYMYIDDLLQAYECIINSKENLRGAFNVGTGTEIKIIDLANLIIKLTGNDKRIKPVNINERPGEVLRLCADYSKFKKVIGWLPKVSIEEGIKNIINWTKNYRIDDWEKPV